MRLDNWTHKIVSVGVPSSVQQCGGRAHPSNPPLPPSWIYENHPRSRPPAPILFRFLQDLEDKRRDEEDERSRKKDDAKIKKMMKANLPQQILAVNAQNDPIPIRRRFVDSPVG